jgi:glutathione S-transferase
VITLCGIPLSNYYNKVKLILLEKNLPFTEERVTTGSRDEAVLAATPLGKVPFVRVDGTALCESQVIADYLEAVHPQPALMPADPLAAAKVRELITFLELHLELVARDLYGQAFFGGTVSDGNKERVRQQLQKNIPALKRLTKFSPYIAGEQLTQADCAAWCHFPLVGMATRAVLGEDLLAAGGIDWKPYIKMLDARPAFARTAADRKVDQMAMLKK